MADIHPVESVIDGSSLWGVSHSDCIPWLYRLPENCCSLVFFSPKYEDARTYGLKEKPIRGEDWVRWMRTLVVAASRVSSGLVAVNMSAKVRDGRYSGVVEMLVADLIRHDGLACWPSPYAWVKMEDRDDALPNGIPGSGGKNCQRRDWEPVYCFARPENLPLKWTDNTAFGTETKETSFGGEFSHRGQDGRRANEYQESQSKMPTFQNSKDGSGKGGHRRVRPKVSNPGNVIGMHSWLRVPVGGGKLGDPLAHECHAPMPLALAERFVRWFAPPGSVVCDPALGSGTTIHAALIHGRRGIGCDLNNEKGGLPTAIKRLKAVEASLSASE